jgi:hypothetical protein
MKSRILLPIGSLLLGVGAFAQEPAEPVIGLSKVFLEGRSETVANEETNLGNLVTMADFS